MVPERYDPMREGALLRDYMRRFFDDPFVRLPMRFFGVGDGAEKEPMMDITEDETGYTIVASLPGMKPEDVKVTINGTIVTIQAESSQEKERKEGSYVLRERRSGLYHRTFTLPEPILSEKAQATFADGELTLTVPRAQKAQVQQIPISAKGAKEAPPVTPQPVGDAATAAPAP